MTVLLSKFKTSLTVKVLVLKPPLHSAIAQASRLLQSTRCLLLLQRCCLLRQLRWQRCLVPSSGFQRIRHYLHKGGLIEIFACFRSGRYHHLPVHHLYQGWPPWQLWRLWLPLLCIMCNMHLWLCLWGFLALCRICTLWPLWCLLPFCRDHQRCPRRDHQRCHHQPGRDPGCTRGLTQFSNSTSTRTRRTTMPPSRPKPSPS